MDNWLVEMGAVAFVIIFSVSLFTSVQSAYPHAVSYRYALEAERAIKGGGSTPFTELTRQVYFATGGTEFDHKRFEMVVKYLPVLLGLVSVIAVYIAARSRLRPEVALLGAVFLASSSLFLLNSAEGVYAPGILSVALFSVSIMLFLLGDVTKPAPVGILLSLAAGTVVGVNMTVSDAGSLLAGAVIASAVAQLAYYVKEGSYITYGTRVAALILPMVLFVSSAKFANIGEHLRLEDAFSTYVLLLPLLAVFVFVALRDLVQETKKYELFFLALAISSVGIALFDPLMATPGMAVGAVFGVAAVLGHTHEKWLTCAFFSLLCACAIFPITNNIAGFGSALALALLAGGLGMMALLMYDSPSNRKTAVFAVVAILAFSSVISGIAMLKSNYLTIGSDWGATLTWAGENLPQDAVVGAIGPMGFVQYLAGRDGCCDAQVARYLLNETGTGILQGAGVTHIIVDRSYLDDVPGLAKVGNVTRPTLETYFFAGYMKDSDTQRFYAGYVSRSGDVMRVQIDDGANPLGQDVQVDSIGQIPYSRLRRFEGESLPIGPGSRIALPLYGERNTLFDIYFENPDGLELLHSEGDGVIRLYRVT